MKFLIDENGGIVNWNGDVSTLNAGTYLLVKKVETIRVIGSTRQQNKRNEGLVAAINDAIDRESAWRNNDVVEEKVTEVLEIPNNDKRAGRIRYWQGERYVELADGRLERFPASDEPQIVEGKLFTGLYYSGKFEWTSTRITPQFVEESKSPVDESPVDEAPVKKKKKKQAEISPEELEELKAIAVEPPKVESSAEDAPFDESAFLDDLVETKDSCWLDSDGVTLMVSFDGSKYKKRFKSDKVAVSQLEVFKALLIEDKDMAKDLLTSSISTFTKI